MGKAQMLNRNIFSKSIIFNSFFKVRFERHSQQVSDKGFKGSNVKCKLFNHNLKIFSLFREYSQKSVLFYLLTFPNKHSGPGPHPPGFMFVLYVYGMQLMNKSNNLPLSLIIWFLRYHLGDKGWVCKTVTMSGRLWENYTGRMGQEIGHKNSRYEDSGAWILPGAEGSRYALL